MDGRQDGNANVVLEIIEALIWAYRYRELALREPLAERGLTKMAVKWSARASTLANGLWADTAIADFDAAVAARTAGS